MAELADYLDNSILVDFYSAFGLPETLLYENNSILYSPNLSTQVSTSLHTNASILYSPTLYTQVITSLYNNISTLRLIFLDFEPITTALVRYDNTPIFYPISSITFNFVRNVNIINNTTIFYPLLIGTSSILTTNLYENISYLLTPIIEVENIAFKGKLTRRVSINRPKNFNFKFSDISFDMFPHPLTGDVSVLYDIDAINQSLKNIIHTRTFERPFSSYNISSKIHELLFELSGAALENEIKNIIFNAIVNNEPRILLYEINVKNILETNSIAIQIYYQIRTIDTIEKFETILVRT